jgi:hypothetical protein
MSALRIGDHAVLLTAIVLIFPYIVEVVPGVEGEQFGVICFLLLLSSEPLPPNPCHKSYIKNEFVKQLIVPSTS